jgi:hypothetical protein
MKNFVSAALILLTTTLFGCATLTNDSHVPIALSFSDNSEGTCTLANKRMQIDVEVPGTAMVRRSDDVLKINCETENGDRASGSIQSELGGKIVASAVFLDFGIVDAITDKHRNYSSSFVIPVKSKKKEESDSPL